MQIASSRNKTDRTKKLHLKYATFRKWQCELDCILSMHTQYVFHISFHERWHAMSSSYRFFIVVSCSDSTSFRLSFRGIFSSFSAHITHFTLQTNRNWCIMTSSVMTFDLYDFLTIMVPKCCLNGRVCVAGSIHCVSISRKSVKSVLLCVCVCSSHNYLGRNSTT